MENLKSYLENNQIDYRIVSDRIVKIDNKTYQLIDPIGESYFDHNFHLLTESKETDFFIIFFGGRYYFIDRKLIKKPQLNILKYIGENTCKIPTKAFLGVHGCYEICNGSRLYEDWVKKAKFLKTEYLGICEKNTLAGILKFQIACQKLDIKAVLGATYTVYQNETDYKYDIKCFIKNIDGYKNILKINTIVNCKNYKFIEEDDLFKYTDGLIFVYNPKSLNYENIPFKKFNLTKYYQLDTVEFVKDREDQEYLLNLQKFLKDIRLQPVSICDAYYLDDEDYYSKKISNTIINSFTKETLNQSFKSKDQYYAELKEIVFNSKFLEELFDLSVQNEIKIAEECLYNIDLSKRHLPKYILTPEQKKKFKTIDNLFWYIIENSIKKLYQKTQWKEALERLKYEYDIVHKNNLLDYFLIQWDIIEYCNRNNILVGPGRGSAAGSILAYLLGIVKIDPLKYGLIFERFLNPGRAKTSLPDIDIDFPSEHRDEVKKYIEERYGVNRVCSVGTYGNMKIKSLIKDLARQKNEPAYAMNILTNAINVDHNSFDDFLKEVAKKDILKNFVYKHPDIINLFPLLLNQPRSESIHASAVIIVPEEENIYESIPVKMVDKKGIPFLVSEWEGNELDQIGYLKQDILGISQLDKFQFIIDQYAEKTGKRFNIYEIDLTDKNVYQLFQKGYNSDVFHFGTKLLQDYCRKVQPNNINDLINTNALLRPGARENNFHNQYLILKNKKPHEIEYISGLEDITKETYGLIIFQEQTMQACTSIANFTLEEADNIRKAMGKKIEELLKSYKAKFIEGAVNNHFLKESAYEIWKKLEKFSGYAFNKSHATAYAIMGYWCQYLKYHLDIYYWAAAFTKINNAKKSFLLPQYISEIHKLGSINLKPANINISYKDVYIDIEERTIYWTLDSIYYCGEKAIEFIVNERDKNGQYFSFSEFCDRNFTIKNAVNKRVIENLILSGVFDEIEKINFQKDRYELILKFRSDYKVKINEDIDIFHENQKILNEDWWFSYQQKFLSEFGFIDYEEVIARYGYNLKKFPYMNYEDITQEKNIGKRVTIAGYVNDIIERESQKGLFARVSLDINYEFFNVLIFPDQYKRFTIHDKQLKKKIIIVSGIISHDDIKDENILKTFEYSQISIL